MMRSMEKLIETFEDDSGWLEKTINILKFLQSTLGY